MLYPVSAHRIFAIMVVFVGTYCSLDVRATASETIKIGVLHSLSGTMAISETTLKDTMKTEDALSSGLRESTMLQGNM